MREHRPQSLLQRLIEEIANMVVYLSSEQQASATTGGALRVDGGYVDAILPWPFPRPIKVTGRTRGPRTH
jgi:hypothetical protein